jgi:hypothetical protein
MTTPFSRAQHLIVAPGEAAHDIRVPLSVPALHACLPARTPLIDHGDSSLPYRRSARSAHDLV